MVYIYEYKLKTDKSKLLSIVYTINDEKWGKYYRVLKILRLLRSPKELSQIETLLEMHRDVVSSFKQFTRSRLVLLAVYSDKIGLLWVYGVSVWSYKLKEAIEWADRIFLALKAVLKGTYRQAVFTDLSIDEASEILRIMTRSDSVAALVGLPEPRDSYSRSPARGYLIGTRMVEMIEEVVRGLVSENREFVYEVLAEPVPPKKLLTLLNRVNDLLTKYSTFEENASLGLYVSLPFAYSKSRMYTSGEGLAKSHSRSRSRGYTIQSSETVSRGETLTDVKGSSETQGIAEHESHTRGISHTTGFSETEGWSHEKGVAETIGKSHTVGHSDTAGVTVSRTNSVTRGQGSRGFETYSKSRGDSETEYTSHMPEVTSKTTTASSGETESRGTTLSESHSEGGSKSWNLGVAVSPFDVGLQGRYGEQSHWTNTTGRSETSMHSSSEQQSESVTKTQPYDVHGESRGRTWQESYSKGESWQKYASHTSSKTVSRTHSHTDSESFTDMHSHTDSESWGESYSRTKTRMVTNSESWTRGVTRSKSETLSEQHGLSRSKMEALGRGVGYSEASGLVEGSIRSRNYSVSEGGVWGLGIVPGLTMSYTAKRLDESKRTVYELLTIEKQRFLEALSSGGFYVQALLLGDKETVESAKALFISSYTPTRPWPEPLYVVDGDRGLLDAARSLSFFLEKDHRHPIRVYKILNIYTSTELAALTHIPRIQVKGIEAVAENIPLFSLPSEDSWDIDLGWAISHETLKPEVRWGFNLDEMGHIGVFGASGSGKTVASTNIAYQLSRKGFKVVVIDWKFEWRKLLKKIENSRFYALYEKKGLDMLKWNPLRPPRLVNWREWMRVVLEWFVLTYGLGSRSMALLRKHLWRLYTEMSPQYPSLKDLYESILEERKLAEKQKVSFDKLDIYDKILDRLWPFAEGDLKELFGQDSDVDIVDIVLQSDFVDFEAGGMADTDKPFILSLIVFSLYYYAKYNGPFSKPVMVIVEEAHQVAFNVREKYSASAVNITEDIWGKLAAEGRAYNLYGLFIVQYPSRLNPMVLANLMSLISFRLNLQTQREQDLFITVYQLGKDPNRFSNEYVRFIERLPVGYAVTIKKKIKEFFKTEPILVKIDLF